MEEPDRVTAVMKAVRMDVPTGGDRWPNEVGSGGEQFQKGRVSDYL